MANEKIIAIESRLAELNREKQQLETELAHLRAMTARSLHPYTPEQKVSIFRNLFRGRDDVYATYWENEKKGTRGYAPAKDFYGNYLKPTDATIKNHLTGVDARGRAFAMGAYPMTSDNRCWFLAVDFDGNDWRDSVRHFRDVCDAAGLPCYVEISRGGNGAHAWLFFDGSVAAADARKMGVILLSRAMAAHPEIGFASYDRLFPNQDILPRGGFGNLIALPLQQHARAHGNTLFVDGDFTPYADQWHVLANARKITPDELERFLSANTAVLTEAETEPWLIPPNDDFAHMKLPAEVDIVLADQIYVSRNGMPPRLVNRIQKLAAFKNPEFYRAQAMRFSTHDISRIISCSELLPEHIVMPRGTLPAILKSLKELDIKPNLHDKRESGTRLDLEFNGTLRPDQESAVKKIMSADIGILAAPTAFGKTVTALWVLAARGVSTLILVHRSQLAEQWKERIKQFLGTNAKVGMIGGGRRKQTGQIDIAFIQTLARRDDLPELMSKYGQLIVDECHHIAAFSFESVAKKFRGKYVLGLTATVERKDGHQPIIMMQCGPITANVPAHTVEKQFSKYIVPRHTFFNRIGGDNILIWDLYAALIGDRDRNEMIAADIATALGHNRACIVLSERKEHLNYFADYFRDRADNMVILTGGMGKKDRAAAIQKLRDIPDAAPLLILATGKFLGEGFDFARLDTMFLTMPISWRGTLAQYAGRLNRDFAAKRDIVIYDYVDDRVPMLAAMSRKRERGYRALGFTELGMDKLPILFAQQ